MTHVMHIVPGRMGHHAQQTATTALTAAAAAAEQKKRSHLHLPLIGRLHPIHAATASATSTMLLSSGNPKTLTCSTSSTCLTSPAHSLIEEEPSSSSIHDAFPRDRIQVAVRLRPILTTQSKDHHHSSSNNSPGWIVQDANQIVQKGIVRKAVGRNVFPMDSVFCESTSTRTVYERSVQPIIQSVFSGMHGTVFAYGQTGSGKTYTMQGGATGNSVNEAENHEGIISMAAMDLFNMIQNSGPQQESTVRVSYYEVYNEEIRDLLLEPMSSRSISPGAATHRSQQQHAATRRRRGMNGHTSVPSCSSSVDTTTAGQQRPMMSAPLIIRETLDGNVYVNACQETVTCAQDVLRLLHKGNCNRAWAATDANAQSSRSHAIFKLTLETRILSHHDMPPPGTTTSMEQADHVALKKRVSWINLVDLAGSENGRHTGATGARRLEGGKINQSLLALSRVIHSLSLPEKKRPKFIGYRDSKLTRILQPSLSGSACVAILCCASLARSDLEETRSTLKFASSAKQIKVKATVNEIVAGDAASAMEIAKLQRELFQVKNELAELKEIFLLHHPKQEAATINAIARPVCVGCIETTGSSTTEDCSTRDDDTTSSTAPHTEEALLNSDDGNDKAHSIADDTDSSRTVSDDDDDVHTHTDRTVSNNGRPHIYIDDDDDDDNTTLSLGDYCSAQSRSVMILWDDFDSDGASEVKVLVRSAAAVPEESSASPREVLVDHQIEKKNADERVSFLQDKLEATKELVEKLYSELQNAMKELQDENLGNLEEFDERLARLEEDKDSKNDEHKILLGWFVLLCFGLYACGMKEFCLSALIFVWLSLQFTSTV